MTNTVGRTALRPWGVGRMRPYPPIRPAGHARVGVDPATQLTVYWDSRGQVVEMGRHGTARGTETAAESTNLDSRNDTDHDQDSEQD